MKKVTEDEMKLFPRSLAPLLLVKIKMKHSRENNCGRWVKLINAGYEKFICLETEENASEIPIDFIYELKEIEKKLNNKIDIIKVIK